VQVDYNVVHLRTSLVQLFVLLLQNFEKLVQMIELKRFGGAPNGYPFAPLSLTCIANHYESAPHDNPTICYVGLISSTATQTRLADSADIERDCLQGYDV
jgi:hypothetical protein